MTDSTTDLIDPIRYIPLQMLRPSPFNPRLMIGDVSQLASSIEQEGRIHQPLLVRPVLENALRPFEEPLAYEVVFGHRRLRAAQVLKLATVPCMVRTLTDGEVRSAQIAENLQREDVHPFEEAEAFAFMLKHDALSADQLAERIGKSRSYVYGRLKLLQACDEVRQACLAGHVGAEVALLLARLRTPKLQHRALTALKGKNLSLEDGGKTSFRRIRALLVDDFTADISSAIFDSEDVGLVPDAGPCSSCPKRSGNAPEFTDVTEADDDDLMLSGWFRLKGPHVCTDPLCFDAKKTAHLKREAQALQAAGKTVLAGAKAKAALSAYGGLKPGYQQVRGKPPAGAQVLHVQDPKSGKVIEAVKLPQAAAEPKGAQKPPQSGQGTVPESREERQARYQRRADQLHAYRRQLMQRVDSSERTREDLIFITKTLWSLISDESYDYDLYCYRPAAAIRAELEQSGDLQDGLIQAAIETMPTDRLAALVISLCIGHALGVDDAYGDPPGEALARLAKGYGVDDAALAETPSEAAAGREGDAQEEEAEALMGDPDEH